MPMAAAAAVGVLAVGLWSAIDQGSSRDVTTRGIATERVLPANSATLERTPQRLEWSHQPGASSYRVTLRTVSATVIWRSEPTSGTEATIPAGVSMAPGATYFWSVEFTGPDTSGSLGPYSFRITEPNR